MCLLATAGYCAPGQDGPSLLLLYVRLDSPPQFSRLKPGAEVTGRLIRPVFSGYQELFPAGSRVHLMLERIERRKRAARADDRPFAVRLFAPRRQSFPIFRSASVTLADGSEVPLRADFIRLTRRVEIRAGSKKVKGGAEQAAIITAEAAGAAVGEQPAGAATRVALAAGTYAHLILMQDLSASKNRRGDRFQARLAEPLREGGKVVLPAGSIFEGLVTKRIPPRRLSRPGTLALTFTKLILPGASAIPLSASLASVEAEKGTRMRMDSETALHGGSPGIGRILIETGVTAGIAKVTDDSMQLVLELLISTATDASTAGTARVVAACVSGIVMLTRHGRDVILPQYTQLEVTLNRAVSPAANLP